jgi:hypothetical protein
MRWIGDIPFKTRYLLIAAYLASQNSKDSDKFTFGDAKKGRRKRVRGGHDTAQHQAEGGAQGSTASTHAPQSFNLERLVTIFKHIYGTNHRMHDVELNTTHTAGIVDVVDTEPGSNPSGKDKILFFDGDDRFYSMVCPLFSYYVVLF